MGRPRKTSIKLQKDSLESLMQEIYNECVSLKNQAIKDIAERKRQAEIEDTADIYQLGKVNNESLKIVDSVIDKKLAIAKLQTNFLGETKVDMSGDAELTDKDKDMLRDMIKKNTDDKDINYDIE
tara:strand:+ start:12601 stop:12975 length:375 start_codon:yes stop_codon:yes gene_type:complete